MPRAESKGSHSSNAPSFTPQGHAGPGAQKKKHICPTCDRAFTTTGHLARHSRVHTGEKNHKCPFPGCETRCSRQDNLQQHYRIHLAPGSRKTSRSGPSRSKRGAVVEEQQPDDGGSPGLQASPTPSIPPPPDSPPPLEDARAYVAHSPPPDSPPPLEQATFPAFLAQRNSSSPPLASPYMYNSHSPVLPLSAPPLLSPSDQYTQSRPASNFHDQSVDDLQYPQSTPLPPISTSPEPPVSYATRYQHSYDLSSGTTLSQYKDEEHRPTHSRHSISHISPSYPSPGEPSQPPPGFQDPPSPAPSSSSHNSGPVYAYQEHPSHHVQYATSTGIMQQMHQHPHNYSPIMPNEAHANLGPSLSRYASPPPILAPIHGYHEDQMRLPRGISPNSDVRIMDERYGGRFTDDRPSEYHPAEYRAQPPHHQQQALSAVSGGYGYADSITVDHGGWKPESGMRPRAVGAL